MKENIIFFSNLFPLPWQPGRATFNKQQVEHLSKFYNIYVLVPVYWTTWLRNRKCSDEINVGGIRVEYFVCFYIPGFARSLNAIFMYFSIISQKRKWLNSVNAKCLFLSWAYPDAVAGTLVAKLLKLPTIIKVHGNDVNVQTTYLLRWLQIKWAFKNSKFIISVSKTLKKVLIDKGITEEQIQVVYNGVDKHKFCYIDSKTSRKELGLNKDKKILIYVGNLKKSKGVLDLLSAFISLKNTLPELSLYYIGVGEEESQLQNMITKSNIGNRVKLLGAMPHDKLPLWYCASDILCLPSYNEGLPNVVLESMSCGTPAVATRVGGIPEILDDKVGVLVEPGEPMDLADGIKRAFSTGWDPGLISRKVCEFTWDKNANNLNELIQRAIYSYNSK